jgi:hypothetical protein
MKGHNHLLAKRREEKGPLKPKHSSASRMPSTVGKNTLSRFQRCLKGAGIAHSLARVVHAQTKCFLINIKIIKRPSRHQFNLLITKKTT